MLKSIEQERDFYKKENEKLVKKNMREESSRSASPVRTSSKEQSSKKIEKVMHKYICLSTKSLRNWYIPSH